MDDSDIKRMLFPHPRIRKIQEDLLLDVAKAVGKKSNLIAHAPTGMGKTAATLAPCLAEALQKKDVTVFFLTSRHTQHQIAVRTLKQIKERHKADFSAVNIIGKKWMCAMPGTAGLYSKDFIAFCKALRDDNKCEFYSNIGTRTKPSVECQKAIRQISAVSPAETGRIISICSREKLCPYEMALLLASRSKVVVTDYFYLLDPFIRDIFMKKIGKTLENSILIFDEAHNIPSRTRDLMTTRLTSFMIDRAVKEAHKHRFEEVEMHLHEIKKVMDEIAGKINAGEEKLIEKESFAEKINKVKDYDEVMAALEFAADEVRESERASYIGSVALFMELWQGPDKGYARIASKKQTRYGEMASIVYRCLDPSLFTKDVIEKSYATVFMSGTLMPTSMYRDLLGFPENTSENAYRSPFPDKNRLVMVVPRTTTKFSMRSEQQYKDIASRCAEIADAVPGSSAVFFPSYGIMEKVREHFSKKCRKQIFSEKAGAEKEEKHRLLDKFKSSRKDAVLLGVAAGSFGEGIDIPNNILKGVVVVGLPLEKPSLETKELIRYYDEKFGKGWDYGYILPAMTRALQNAGRCIRSEKDNGVMVFLDKRYSWPNYIRCFPDDWDIRITVDYAEEIAKFFDRKQESAKKT